MADIHFECTLCAKCCHDLKVPLTVAETIDWLNDGHDAQVICEAVPWPVEPHGDDLQAAHKKGRSFAAMSGSLPTRVMVTLAAMFVGACPNLQEDLCCGIYERRPLVCRIYPAEINPFIELSPANKGCPEEAWTADRPLLSRNGFLVDPQLQALIQKSRDANVSDVRVKQILCSLLHLDATAVANEGLVVHSPDRADLLNALNQARSESSRPIPDGAWRYISNRSSTVEVLASVGAISFLMSEEGDLPFKYLGFQPPT